MKMNRTLVYALTCLWELAQRPFEWTMAGEIALRHNLPVSYCYKVLESLARAGLIESVRGQGFQLTRPLDRISCLELMEACSEGAREQREIFGSGLVEGFRSQMNHLLQGLTLQDLVRA